MKKLALYILPFVLLAINSCKKNPLPPDNGPPSSAVFYMNGTVNGFSVSLEAGNNNYYMYSSHYQDPNNVYVYKADLKPSSCTGTSTSCYAITVLINDNKVSAHDSVMTPNSFLVPGNYEFNDGNLTPLGYTGRFMPLVDYQSLHAPFTWTFYDGISTQTSSTGPFQSAYYSFKNNQTYSVSCKISDISTPKHTNVFKIGSPLQANIYAKADPPFTFNYSVTTTEAVSNYHCEFGDGNVATTNINTMYHTFPTISENYYTTKLTLSNALDTCISYYQVPAFSNTTTCHANFTNSFTPVPNTKSLSAVTILLTDLATGTVYSSGALNQGAGNKFEIISVEDYKPNEAGEPTKKLKINFNCTVKNGNNSLTINNGNAVIAVSYKKI
jgi:hypothetical protein